MQSRFSYALCMFLRMFLPLCGALCWTSLLFAGPLPAPKIQPPNLVHLGRGKTVTTQIDVAIAKPFHVQANPASKAGMVATEIIVEPAPGIRLEKVRYPHGVPFKFAQAGEPIEVYEGEFGIGLVLKADGHAEKGKQNVHAHLKYQACDEKTCFRPTELPFEFSVEIE